MERLRPLPGPHVRVPLQWLTKPGREHAFEPEQRLLLYVLYRSYWGQRGVKLTNAVAGEIGMSRTTKTRVLGRLERKGWIRIERSAPHEAPIVWPIVLSA
jgi:DNA-binding MarR family transcriptional regulator